MEINLLGLVAAMTAFFSIWIGHVAVRKIEAVTIHLWKPICAILVFGLALETSALMSSTRLVSVVFGILGVTLLWDAFELRRQAQRIYNGHAPANPNNQRHAAILAEAGSRAITINLLDRDPIGRTVDREETVQLVERHGA